MICDIAKVDAWLTDKDVEALRCQKLLVEEEEDTQRRQAELLEKKRLRRLRHKEQKAKGHRNVEKTDVNNSYDMKDDVPPMETCMHGDIVEVECPDSALDLTIVVLDSPQFPDNAEEFDSEVLPALDNAKTDFSLFQRVEPGGHPGVCHQNMHVASWNLLQRSSRPTPSVLSEVHRNLSPRPEFKLRHGSQDSKIGNSNNMKVWSRKSKPDKERENLNFKVQETFPDAEHDKKREVLIDSITVALDSFGNSEHFNTTIRPGNGPTELKGPRNDVYVKANRPVSAQSNQSRGKLWRSVSRNGVEDQDPVAVNDKGPVSPAENGECQELAGSNHLRLSPTRWFGYSNESVESEIQLDWEFSIHAAKDFLTQRWKEAMVTEHAVLVLLPESEPPGSPDNPGSQGCSDAAKSHTANADHLAKVGHKMQQDMSFKKEYIPKQRGSNNA